jgi:hypothetical protein
MRPSLARSRPMFAALFVWMLGVGMALGQEPTPINRTDNLVSDLTGCLGTQSTVPNAKEVVLLEDKWLCAERYKGAALIGDTIVSIDPTKICASDGKDQRRLPSDIIKKISEKKDSGETQARLPAGIRILGAVFCEAVDLSDLTLPYSLVLDHGLFKSGIRGQNLSLHGDFSVDSGLIFNGLELTRSHILGSVYGRGSLIQRLLLFDTEVRGSVNLNGSLLIASTRLDKLNVLVDLDLDESMFSHISLVRSTIGGQVDLSRTEARCGYEVSNNTIDDLLANEIGLGSTVFPAGDPETIWYAWNRPMDTALTRLARNAAVSKIIGSAEPCLGFVPDSEILVSGNKVQSLCFQSIGWLASRDERQPPTSFFTLADNVVSGNMYVGLWPSGSGKPSTVLPDRHMFQLIGTTAGTFIFSFKDNEQPYVTVVDRIRFDRVETADIDCEGRSRAKNWRLPTAHELEKWLEKNTTASTVFPISTFIDAFQHAGVDPIELKILKARVDLESDLSAKWHQLVTVMESGSTGDKLNYIFSLNRLIDIVGISLNVVAGAVADFGFRPYKSIIYIALALLVIYLFIVGRLKVTHAQSEIDNRKFRIGVLFLFDRMVPGYDFDPAHFKIKEYLFNDGRTVDERTKQLVERTLLLIKIIGILAALFIAASLKSIIPG